MISGKSALAIKSGFTREDLRRISGNGDGWRLSLYMPLHRTGREIRQAPILLKDLRARAASILESRGCPPETIRELLAPCNQIQEETDFSLLQGEGLAILSGRGRADSFLVPFAPPAMVEAGHRFLVDPLLPLLFEDGRFHLLSLSLNAVRLYRVDRLRLQEVSLEGMAVNMREALRIEDDGDNVGFHSATPPSGRDRKRDILEFCRLIDRGLKARIGWGDQPLMLAGVEYLQSLYREASTHPRILEGALAGNPDSAWDAQDLHAKAWKAYREEREKEKDVLLRLYRERLATPLAAAGLRNVLPAAAQGRASHLFVRKGLRQWGRFDPADFSVTLDDSPAQGNEELVNLACIQALLGGAKVFTLEPGELPEKAEIAALCRY